MSLSDLQKKLEKESQGIMFPFSASASTVNTTQNVYDSATDGIMTGSGGGNIGVGTPQVAGEGGFTAPDNEPQGTA